MGIIEFKILFLRFGKGKYIDSETVKKHMDIFLEQYSKILSILKKTLECNTWLEE